jgi:hypothetical protein
MAHVLNFVLDTGVTDGLFGSKHTLVGVSFNGAVEVDLQATCTPEVLKKLEQWRSRADHTESGTELLNMDNCAAFSISYEGQAGNYWPNEKENDISEAIVRDFLYHEGICSLDDEKVRLFHVKYRAMALDGDEYLLVCPYLTAANNISGIVVVCVTKTI